MSEDGPIRQLIRGLLWWCLRVNSRWVLALGRLLYGLEIHGQAHLPSNESILLICRHNSRIEIFGLAFFCSILPVQKEFYGLAAAPVLVGRPFFSWLCRILGTLPAFKERGISAVPLLEAYNRLTQGKIVGLGVDEVPWDGRPQPPRPGAAWLALRTGSPVVAFVLQGAYDIWPRWASRPHLTGKLVLRIGKSFHLCDAPCNRVTEEMLRDANRVLMAELDRLSTEGRFSVGREAKEVEHRSGGEL